MFGWNIFETKRTVGGLFGYESEKVRVRRKEPSSKGVSAVSQLMSPDDTHRQQVQTGKRPTEQLDQKQSAAFNSRGPKMTAFHIMMLSGFGLPEMPIGGSEANRLKSRMRRRLA